MNEIEVKILDIDKNKVIEKLESLGAKKEYEGKVNAIFFDFPDKKLAKDDSFLRLRNKEKFAELTLKKKVSKSEAKVMEETEITCDDFENAKKILSFLGLVESKSKANKYRISYSLDNVHFEIDSLEAFPTYLEIEAPNLEKLKSAVEKLGFSMKDAKPWSMKDVKEYYQKKK
ncbi:MAG: class IV adenylate cyclase [Nanoarchaeota archaeon]